MNLNKMFILGHMAADPENRMLPSGRPVTNFRVATNRVWTDETGNRQEAAEFHRVVAFGKLADVAAHYLTKGQLVFVEGRVQTRSWQTQDGSKRYQTEIVAEGLQLGPRLGGSFTPRDGSSSQTNSSSEWQGSVPPPRTQLAPPPPPPALAEAPQPEESLPVVDLDEESVADSPKEKIRPEDLPF